MSLLRVYVYQVNYDIWVCCACELLRGVFKLHGLGVVVKWWNLVFLEKDYF